LTPFGTICWSGRGARRIQDNEILHLLKGMLTASGKRGVPQGGVISPLLSNVYLTEVDAMLERAKAVTGNGSRTYVEYARYADDRAPRRCREEAAM
jgi:RNA-directed DNA polymerase